MDQPDLIRDIPRYRETITQIREMKSIRTAMPLMRPLLWAIRADTKGIDIALGELDDLERRCEELATMPDRFNDQFSQIGWIAYDDLNVDVAMAAIAKADAGDIQVAEDVLVEYYNSDHVRTQLRRMVAVEAFAPRMRLAELAVVDYAEGRYYACIPVVFALLDGMVNEVGKQNRGFFAEGADLSAWDSIAGHDKGLKALAAIFSEGRKKTRTDPITIPYRNGILHGMDLGYDNVVVAAKVWAALFAAREWALKVQNGVKEARSPEPKLGLLDTFRKLGELEQYKRRLKVWKPRPATREHQIVRSEPEAFEQGTPEQCLAEFLSYWRRGNYGFMSRYISSLLRTNPQGEPAKVRATYDGKKLISFKLIEIEDQAAAATEITSRLVVESDGQQGERTFRFRMICEDESGHSAVRGAPGSHWTVINWDVAAS